AIHKSFQNQRTIPNAHESTGRYREVVVDEIQLGQADLFGEIKLVRVRHMNLTVVDCEYFGRGLCCPLLHLFRLTATQLNLALMRHSAKTTLEQLEARPAAIVASLLRERAAGRGIQVREISAKSLCGTEHISCTRGLRCAYFRP